MEERERERKKEGRKQETDRQIKGKNRGNEDRT